MGIKIQYSFAGRTVYVTETDADGNRTEWRANGSGNYRGHDTSYGPAHTPFLTNRYAAALAAPIPLGMPAAPYAARIRRWLARTRRVPIRDVTPVD